jgi:hypothetical protein
MANRSAIDDQLWDDIMINLSSTYLPSRRFRKGNLGMPEEIHAALGS